MRAGFCLLAWPAWAAGQAASGPSPVDAAALQRAAAPAELSGVERAFIGTWQPDPAPAAGASIQQYRVRFSADGTYRLEARMAGDAGGPPRELINLGRWSASRGLFSTVITHSADGQPVDLAKPGFAQVYLVESQAAAAFSYRHLSSGTVFRFTRVAEGGDAPILP